MSFQLRSKPQNRAAARANAEVRELLWTVLLDEKKEKRHNQASIARALGVGRSSINRQLTGGADLSVAKAAQIAWAMGRKLIFSISDPDVAIRGENTKGPQGLSASGAAPVSLNGIGSPSYEFYALGKRVSANSVGGSSLSGSNPATRQIVRNSTS